MLRPRRLSKPTSLEVTKNVHPTVKPLPDGDFQIQQSRASAISFRFEAASVSLCLRLSGILEVVTIVAFNLGQLII